MTRNNWHKRSEDSPSSSESGKSGKTVRFMNNHHHNNNYGDKHHSANIYNVAHQQQQQIHPVHGMVQQLVPHLPGLDKDKVYVISGPFPNFDPVSGPSQCLMATPVSAGATIIAVPSGPPPPVHAANGGHGQHVAKAEQRSAPVPVSNGNGGQVYHPPNPQMLHWDNLHPTGHILPLRQPNPPVYYNVPAGVTPGGSDTSSGLQSPCSGSDGCCMSDCSSDTSPDTPDTAAATAGPMAGHKIVFQPSPAPYQHINNFMDIHTQKHFQDPPHYCHLRGQDPYGAMFIPSHCPPHPPHGLDHMMVGQQQRINQQVCM